MRLYSMTIFMLRFIFSFFLFVLPLSLSPVYPDKEGGAPVMDTRAMYLELGLDGEVLYKAFEQAYNGWLKVESDKPHLLTLIDFSKPSTAERFYVLDFNQKKVLFKSHVAHGRNSGGNYATSFSNVAGSYQSSLGFYRTGVTYHGRNGYSLRLDGLEKGINDKAYERAIVIHGAAYANPSIIGTNGRLGRSFGCPALPETLNKAVIDVIKGGSLLFIYADDNSYVAQSEILSQPLAAL